MRILGSFRDASLTLMFPRGCQICGGSVENFADGAVCADCWRRTKIFSGAEILCSKCGRLLEHGAKFDETVAPVIFCHRCDADSFDAARAVGIYDGALRVSVLELKEKPFVPARLKNLFRQSFQNHFADRITKIVPVPLHAKRLRERGFNQAAVLARVLGLPVLENCLVREIHTAMHRGAMDERARRESVEKVFAVHQPRLLENEKILLVDDVFTSGATVSACAAALKEKGAGAVFVLTVARVA